MLASLPLANQELNRIPHSVTIRTHYPNVQVVLPDECKEIVGKTSENGGANRVIKVAVEP